MTSPPRKAVRPRLTRKMSAASARREIASACLNQIRANEPGVLAGRDPEYLHQFRVGWRRLRCALSMPRDPGWRAALAVLRPELRWLSHELGTARNWDVFTSEILSHEARRIPPGSARLREFAAFRTRCARIRRERGEAVRTAMRSDRYRRLLLDLGELIATMEESVPGTGKARDFAEAILRRRRRKLGKKYTRPLSAASAAERHRIRIATKKLHYASELLAGLFPGKKTRRYCKRLERLQDALGDLNDLANGMRMTAEASRPKTGRSGARIGKLVQVSLRRRDREKLAELDSAWVRLARKKPFWNAG